MGLWNGTIQITIYKISPWLKYDDSPSENQAMLEFHEEDSHTQPVASSDGIIEEVKNYACRLAIEKSKKYEGRCKMWG